MIEIRGRYNTALCYTSALEEKAAEQIRTVCDQEEFAGCRIRIMPDVHAGKGCTIGTTMTISDKVVPGMVGVDIGCGMETVRLAEREIDFAALDALIRREVPSGRNVRGGEHPFNAEIDLSELRCAHSVSLDWARRSIGTLGGAMLGVAVITLISNGLDMINASSYLQQVVIGAMLLIVLAYRHARKK